MNASRRTALRGVSSRNTGSTSKLSSGVIFVVIGMVFGGAFVAVVLLPFTTFLAPNSNNNSNNHSGKQVLGDTISTKELEEQQRQQQQRARLLGDDGSIEDGWHPIHVFYGEREALLGEDEEERQKLRNQKWFAQVHQDEVVVDLLGETGYFIDLAANDAKEWSNTIALERYNWNGLCIEPNPVYWYGLSHRKCTVVGAMLGGDDDDTGETSVGKTNSEPRKGPKRSQVKVKFRGVFGGIVGKANEKMADRKHEPDAPTEVRYTVPFREVLQRFNAPKVIDYLSLDVEGAETMIMEKFPFDEYQIRILSIERPKKKLKTLLLSKGYQQLKRLAWWGETLWAANATGFTPEHPKIAKIVEEVQH